MRTHWRRVQVPRFWLGLLVATDLVAVAPVSLVASIFVLVLMAVAIELDPRAPLIVGAGVVAGLPILVALGGGAVVDGYATVAIALVTISIVLLAGEERKRLR